MLRDWSSDVCSSDLPKIDLQNQNIHVTTFGLAQSKVNIHLLQNPVPPVEEPGSEENLSSAVAFTWPDWSVQIDEIKLEENDIHYFVGENKITPGVFNPDAIALSELNLDLKNLYLKDNRAGGQLQEFSLLEGSGISINGITFDLDITDHTLEAKDILFDGMNSYLQGSITSRFDDITDLIALEEKIRLDIHFPRSEEHT